MDQSYLDAILKATKEYSFLITIVGSIVVGFAYMILFRVKPWDQARASKLRRDRVRFHNTMGYTLIESGHFAEARAEFEEAINLSAEDQTALTGRYIANLFISTGSSVSDPAIAFAIVDHISESDALKRDRHLHIIDKLLGDLYTSTSNYEKAREYYLSALKRKPDYANALYAMGWHYYSGGDRSEIDDMERMFRSLTEVSPRDYRGFHGLGYALYMKALSEQDEDTRSSLRDEAAKQSGRAKDIVFNQLNIVMDFGEVARSVDPELALVFHNYAKEILADPVLREAGDNPYPLLARLLMSDGQISIASKDEKLSWIEYQTALDYLAMERMYEDPQWGEEHKRHFEEAQGLDVAKTMHHIYLDQLAVLDLLLPGKTVNSE